MKTIFNEAIRAELINRIQKLSSADKAEWGKMNVYQMLGHCTLWDEWILGKRKPRYKQAFIGLIFGKLALKRVIKDDRPLDRNVPTSSFLIIKEEGVNIEDLKTRWCSFINDYSSFSNPEFVHDFFGKLTEEQIGILVYKHTDHHLRQFNR